MIKAVSCVNVTTPGVSFRSGSIYTPGGRAHLPSNVVNSPEYKGMLKRYLLNKWGVSGLLLGGGAAASCYAYECYAYAQALLNALSQG